LVPRWFGLRFSSSQGCANVFVTHQDVLFFECNLLVGPLSPVGVAQIILTLSPKPS
jgi:hypothetical protein